MRTKQAITRKLDVSAQKAWDAISGIDGLERWFPIIATCRVEGKGLADLVRSVISAGIEGMNEELRRA